MGVNLKDLIQRNEISIDDLSGKTLAVDSYNILYQFLSTIRQRDGTPLKDSKGRITSHLIGLFSRTTHLMQKGIRLIFVFDGEPPELKRTETKRRAKLKQEAALRYEQAVEKEDIGEMKKYAARTSRLTSDMIEQAKTLISLLGIPIVQAPSEGEAQASYIVKKKDAWAVASQDYDSLLYGAARLIQNLSIVGRRKKPGTLGSFVVKPSLIELSANLKSLGINTEQLIALAMLIGTDYNPGGIKGIGPKSALKIVKEYTSLETLFANVKWDDFFEVSWKQVYSVIKNMPVSDKYDLSFGSIKKQKIIDFLVGEHDFSEERVLNSLEPLEINQQSLGAWFRK